MALKHFKICSYTCVCVSVCGAVSAVCRPEEDVQCPGAGATGSWEWSDMDAGIQTLCWVLGSSLCPLTAHFVNCHATSPLLVSNQPLLPFFLISLLSSFLSVIFFTLLPVSVLAFLLLSQRCSWGKGRFYLFSGFLKNRMGGVLSDVHH